MSELSPYLKKYPTDQISAMISYWVDGARMLLNCEQHNLARCFRIKYEDIALQPIASLEKMFDFLGVNWDASLLNSVFTTPHDEGDGDPKILRTRAINPNSIGNGSAISLGQVPHSLVEQMNSILEQLGYSPHAK